jgi:hypothetical protein
MEALERLKKSQEKRIRKKIVRERFLKFIEPFRKAKAKIIGVEPEAEKIDKELAKVNREIKEKSKAKKEKKEKKESYIEKWARKK